MLKNKKFLLIILLLLFLSFKFVKADVLFNSSNGINSLDSDLSPNPYLLTSTVTRLVAFPFNVSNNVSITSINPYFAKLGTTSSLLFMTIFSYDTTNRIVNYSNPLCNSTNTINENAFSAQPNGNFGNWTFSNCNLTSGKYYYIVDAQNHAYSNSYYLYYQNVSYLSHNISITIGSSMTFNTDNNFLLKTGNVFITGDIIGILPNVYFINNNQNQSNISTNTFGLQINSSITSTGIISNITNNTLSYNIYTNLNNGCSIFEGNNCIAYNNHYENTTMNAINTTFYTKNLYDNMIFPAYYPFNYKFMDITQHLNYTAYSGNNIRFKIFNFSTTQNYTLNLEFDAINKTDVTSNLLIYYCNSSYLNGNPALRDSCILIDSFTPQQFSHTHNQSLHQVIPVVIPQNFSKTQNCSIIYIANSNVNNGWNFGYVTNSSYNNNSFEEGNFNAFSLGSTVTNKIFDMHLHPFGSNDTFNYFTTFNDNGIITTSSEKKLYYNKVILPPSAVDFILPFCNGSENNVIQYTLGSSTNITIQWTQSNSQSGEYPLYNLSYTNYLGTDNNILSTAINDTLYIWNTTSWNSLLTSGDYKFRIVSYDSIGSDTSLLQCTFNICENNWQMKVEPCIDNIKLINYYDNSSCNEQFNIPIINGSYTSCIIPSTEGEDKISNSIYALGLIILIIGIIYFKKNEVK